ncbi:MAG: hypothetical protein KAJ46_08265 [Sedimentisphaerales bacterium]|nr:hypothetical protein [Sedimentisphaerales bacterium]
MNTIKRFFPTGLIFGSLLLAGCVSTPVESAKESIIVEAEAGILWQSCKSELKNRGFRLDRVDLRSGVIDTFPMVSRQWFEFWRHDVVDTASLAESSLQTIRRRVGIKLTPLGGNKYRFDCRVTVQRLSMPAPTVSGSVWAESVFYSTAGRSPIWNDPDDTRAWITLDNDTALADNIIRSVKTALKKI